MVTIFHIFPRFVLDSVEIRQLTTVPGEYHSAISILCTTCFIHKGYKTMYFPFKIQFTRHKQCMQCVEKLYCQFQHNFFLFNLIRTRPTYLIYCTWKETTPMFHTAPGCTSTNSGWPHNFSSHVLVVHDVVSLVWAPRTKLKEAHVALAVGALAGKIEGV